MTLLRRADSSTTPALQRDSHRTRVRSAIGNRTFLLALLCAALCASPSQASGQNLQPAEQATSIHGTVVNSVTHAPIARALVYSGDDRFALLTDGEGHFEFALPKPNPDSQSGSVMVEPSRMSFVGPDGNPFFLMARKPGYLDDPNSRIQQLATPPGGDVTISLLPEALIIGRVMIPDGDAALGVNVQVFRQQVQDGMPHWVQSGFSQANSGGEFRFADLQAGSYKLVTHELMENDPAATVSGGQQYGFPPVYFPGVADFAAAATIQLTAGQTVQADIPLTRQPYYPVRIPVANDSQSAGLNITVSVQGHRGPGYSLGYNAEKHRIEGSLPRGNYLIEAATFGQNSSYGSVRLVVAGGPADGPEMTLAPNASIRLNVTEEFTGTNVGGTSSWSDGRQTFALRGPRAYLQAMVESANDFQQSNAMLRPPRGPDDQQLVIDDLQPGRYWLRLTSNRGYVASATMGGVDLLHEPLVVSPGSTMPVEIKMRDDEAELDGTVTGVAADSATATGSVGAQMPNVWVYCVPLPDSPGRFEQIGVSSQDAKFTSQYMVPGAYRILAFKIMQMNLPFRDPETMKIYESKGQVVHLVAGQKTNAQVEVISSE